MSTSERLRADTISTLDTIGTGTNSLTFGANATTNNYGGMVSSTGSFTTAGDAQTGRYIVRNITTDNTLTELFADGLSAQLIIPQYTSWIFKAQIMGQGDLSRRGSARTGFHFLFGGPSVYECHHGTR